jgi:hypothetical protein
MSTALLSDVRLAVRAMLQSLVVCSTGSTTLAATATGFTRATGSFLADGFRVGYEVTPSGFADNSVSVIVDVTDTTMALLDARKAQAAGAGRALTCGVPTTQIYGSNLQPVVNPPSTDRPFLFETFLPGTGELRGLTQGGTRSRQPIYTVQWWGVTNTGDESLTKPADIITDVLFTPNTVFPVPNLRVRGDLLPAYTLVEQDNERQRPVCSISVYLELYNT